MVPRYFEWDPEKSEKNRVKHGIDFMDAMKMWRGPVLEVPTRPGTDETRHLVYGLIGGLHWTAVITHRGKNIRIISVRRSRSREAEAYDHFKGR